VFAPAHTTVSPAKATHGEPYTGTLTPGAGYALPTAVTVTVAGHGALTLGTDFTYTGGVVTIDNGALVIGDITIAGAARPYYTLDIEVSPLTPVITGSAGIALFTVTTGTFLADAPVSLVAEPITGWHFVDWTTTDTAGATLFTDSGTIATATYTMPAASGTVTANFAINIYDVYAPANTTVSPGTATHGQPYAGTLTANPGYALPTSVTVSIAGHGALTPGTEFSYSGGVVTIANGDLVTGDITIAGTAPLYYRLDVEVAPVNTGTAGIGGLTVFTGTFLAGAPVSLEAAPGRGVVDTPGDLAGRVLLCDHPHWIVVWIGVSVTMSQPLRAVIVRVPKVQRHRACFTVADVGGRRLECQVGSVRLRRGRQVNRCFRQRDPPLGHSE